MNKQIIFKAAAVSFVLVLQIPLCSKGADRTALMFPLKLAAPFALRVPTSRGSMSTAQTLEKSAALELITWNVGQGQWVTWESETTCEHFDIGGEFAPWKSIVQHCGLKLNRAHFSHWDWDHIGLAARAKRTFKNFCVVDFPRGPAPSHGKEKILELPKCSAPKQLDPASNQVHQLFWRDSTPMTALTSNDLSRVFALGTGSSPLKRGDGIIVPGDSTSREELHWGPLATRSRPTVLVLGHHGSHTSSSEFLLKHLPELRLAISSARFARYGHPHPEIVRRLRAHGVALLRTEEWGTIRIEIRTP